MRYAAADPMNEGGPRGAGPAEGEGGPSLALILAATLLLWPPVWHVLRGA